MKLRLLLFLFCISFRLFGQEETGQQQQYYPWSVNANVHSGVLLPEYGFIAYLSNDYARGFEFNACRHTTGKSPWERLYRYPSWGMSFFYSTMGNSRIFGNQYTLYPYYRLSIIEKGKIEFAYQMGVGASWATLRFDPSANYENLAIGSHLNIHYHADLLTTFRLRGRMKLNAGLSFNHISNANLSEPNVGLNFCTLFAGLRFDAGKAFARNTEPVEPLKAYWVKEIYFCGGMKHTRTFESFHYPAVSAGFEIKRRLKYKFSLGAGADFFYDSSVQPQMERLQREFHPSDAYMTGIHISEEFHFANASVIVQEGVYLGLTEKLFGYFMYNRAIARYHFCNHFFVSLSMKSHLYVLDFPEAGVGVYW